MCAAVALFACLDTCAKFLTQAGYPPGQVVCARYVVNLLLLLVVINPWTVPGVLASARPGVQVVRGLLLLGSTTLNFIGLQYLQLAETSAIMFATPVIVAVLAGLFLKQWIGPGRWAAIAAGFLGVLVVTRPGFDGLPPAAFLAVAGAFCYAIYNLLTRELAGLDRPETTILLGSACGAIASLVFLALPGGVVMPASLRDWGLMLGLGFFGLVGHWCLILAHRHVSAQDLSPYSYSQIVWMILFGHLVFADVPSLYTLIGAGIVIASGLALLVMDRRRAA